MQQGRRCNRLRACIDRQVEGDVEAVRGQVWSDTRVRTAGGAPLHGAVRLPELPGVEPVQDPVLDTIGRLVSERRLLLASGVGAGLLAGSVFPGGGLLRRLGGGLLGAIAGAAATMGVARLAELASGRGAPDSDAFVHDVAHASSTPRRGESGERLRVLDWNVRDLIGPDGRVRTDDAAVDAIERVVMRERPDVLVLQEVSQDFMLGGFANGLQELAERLGASDAVLVPNGVRASGRVKGNAVLVFGDARIQDARGLRHPDPGGAGVLRQTIGALAPLEQLGMELPDALRRPYFPRTTADVLVTTAGGTDVRVLDVHLSGTGVHTGGTPGSDDAQYRQLAPVAATIDAWRGPTLLMGDFNVKGGTSHHAVEREILGAAGMRDLLVEAGHEPGAASARTFPATGTAKGIDRAYASNEFALHDARVLSDPDARAGSDHLPLVTELELR